MNQIVNNIFLAISNTIGPALTNVLGALLILIIGSWIAKLIKRVVTKLIIKTKIDDKLNTSNTKFSLLGGKLLYIIVMIFVFTLALEKLGITNVLDPVKGMISKFASFIPNIVGAGLVAYIGYMLAGIVSDLVALSGDTIQKITPKLHLPNNLNLVNILQKIVFIFIFIPILIIAFQILEMNAISDPATQMLHSFFNAIPKILLAVIILILFTVGGKFVTELLKDLLNSMNLNELLEKMNIKQLIGEANAVKIISNLVFFFILMFGITTALEKLEFETLTDIMGTITDYAGRILFGMGILLAGNWIATLVSQTMSKGENNEFVAAIARVAIIAVFLAIGLRAMGIANEIINLAFGITLGTVAITIILSFGLGGKEAAGQQMKKIIDKFNKN